MWSCGNKRGKRHRLEGDLEIGIYPAQMSYDERKGNITISMNIDTLQLSK